MCDRDLVHTGLMLCQYIVTPACCLINFAEHSSISAWAHQIVQQSLTVLVRSLHIEHGVQMFSDSMRDVTKCTLSVQRVNIQVSDGCATLHRQQAWKHADDNPLCTCRHP